MGRHCTPGFFLAACLAASAATADVRIEGEWSYSVSGDQVTVEVDRIANRGSSATGTLYLTLWLTSGAAPDAATSYRAARVSLHALAGGGKLRPGRQYRNIRLTTPYLEPSPGVYHVHLTVSEWPHLDTALDLATAPDTLVVESHREVRMQGAFSYSLTGHELTLAVERIENLGGYRTSGTLYLTMWLTAGPDPYTAGHVAGRASLAGAHGDNGALRPGQSFHDVSLTMPYTAPPPGTYYVHFYLSEWPTLDVALDLVTFTDTFTTERKGLAHIDMVGTVSYLISDDEVTLEVEEIVNRRADRTSGTLHLTLWLTATPDPYTKGGVAGRASLASRYSGDGTLPPGKSFYNVKLTMPYDEPPPGTYYLHLYVSEQPDIDTVLDLETFARPLQLAQDDHGDEPSAATPVAARSATRGELQWRGDIDVFRVRVAVPGTLRVGTIGTTDTYGSLSDQRGRVVATDDDSGARLNFHINQWVGGGVWYIAVRGFNRSAFGQYALTVAFEPDVAAPDEAVVATISGNLRVASGQVLDGDTPDPGNPRTENDTIASAQRIPTPVSVAGHVSHADDSHDIYLLTLPGPSLISLAIADTGADLDLHVADTGGSIVAESLGDDDLEFVHTGGTGDHIVMVSARSGASNYTLVVGASAGTDRSTAAATGPGASSRDGPMVSGELIVAVPAGRIETLAAGPAGAMHRLERLGLAPSAATPSGTLLVGVDGSRPSLLAEAPTLKGGLHYADAALRDRAVTMLRRKRLLASGEFDEVQPNYIYRTMAEPADPYFRYQWHHAFIGLPQAWDATTGDDRVVVAVIDTGMVTDHPDLASRLLRDAGNRPAGYDFINDPNRAADGDGVDSDPYDMGDRDLVGTASSFHGTHVAGTIAAGTNNGEGVAGVMWHGRIMPIRVLGRGGGSSLDIAEGIRYAAGLRNVSGSVPPRRADIINLSLGVPNPNCIPHRRGDTVVGTAIEDAIRAGVVVVVAAGNDNCHWPDPMTTVAGVISVGAADQRGRAPYSNFGAELDVVAPGGNMHADIDGDGMVDGVLSASADDSGGDTQPTYHFSAGTSMAAPHVAGVLGLMLSVNPRLEPADITRLLEGTHPDPAAAPITRDWGVPGRDDEFGNGLIDASWAVRVARAIRGGEGGAAADRPVLAVSPTRLHFDATATMLRIEISNVGVGILSTRSVTPDRAWMRVSLDKWPNVAVHVDRAGLSEGTFTGNIQIDSDGGTVGVPVTLRVQRAVRHADVGRLHVLALTPDTYELRAHATTSARDGYAFALRELPAGRYVIAAGTDRDNDGYICDAGEACGVWPLRDSPAVVEIDGDRWLDFGVSISLFASIVSQSVRASPIAPDGFRRVAGP